MKRNRKKSPARQAGHEPRQTQEIMKKTISKTRNIGNFSEAFGFLSAQDDEQMMVIYGPPGTGKTTAAAYIAQRYDAALVVARPQMTPFQLVKAILAELGQTCRSYGGGLEKIIGLLKDSGKALFIDEIDYLLTSYTLIETLRSIHDSAGVPVIMVGMSGVYNKLVNHRQLCDRIHFLEFENCDLQDTKLLAERCEVAIEADLLEHIHQQAKGNIRLIKRMLAYIEAHSLAMDWSSCNLQQWGKQPLLPKFAIQPTKKRGAA